MAHTLHRWDIVRINCNRSSFHNAFPRNDAVMLHIFLVHLSCRHQSQTYLGKGIRVMEGCHLRVGEPHRQQLVGIDGKDYVESFSPSGCVTTVLLLVGNYVGVLHFHCRDILSVKFTVVEDGVSVAGDGVAGFQANASRVYGVACRLQFYGRVRS